MKEIQVTVKVRYPAAVRAFPLTRWYGAHNVSVDLRPRRYKLPPPAEGKDFLPHTYVERWQA